MSASPACMHLYHTIHVWWPWTPEEGESPRTGVGNACGLPRGYRELELGPPQKQVV